MSGKSKRRREARRRARQQSDERQETAPQGAEPSAEAAEREELPAQRPVQSAASEHGHRRAARKRSKRKGGLWQRLSGVHVSGWMIAAPVVVIGVGVLAFLILSSGSSGTSGGDGSDLNEPDPRVAGLTPDVPLNIEARGAADDASFSPNTVTASAGDVIEFVVTNTGSVSHNLRVSGPNGTYDVDTTGEKGDDFEMPPNVIGPGETQRLVVKIDEPGTYPFRCDFHPLVQTGTLTLQ